MTVPSHLQRAGLVLLLLATPALLGAQYPAPNPDQAYALPQDVDYVVPDDGFDDVPAHVAVVDGTAWLEREGRREPLEENIILLAGDLIRTERGRAEILFDDGSAIDIDYDTAVELLSNSLLRMNAGRVRLTLARGAEALDYRVDAAGVSAWIQSAGEYLLTLRPARGGELELGIAVRRGQAELETPLGRTRVRPGQQAYAVATVAPSVPFVANAAILDDFDRWANDQQNARLGVVSSRYLPDELSYYGGAFDSYGEWDYLPTYGYVWYPRVEHDWRPYWEGRWSFYVRFGWTWHGRSRWHWPTHHYGRWGLHANRWFWVPGRRWAPAWVAWGHTRDWVSWCPLGFDNRPVIQITNININIGRDPWRAWTVIPARTFRPNVVVASHVVSRQALPSTAWSNFVVQRSAPIRPAINASRSPLQAPTYRGQAVSRTSGARLGSDQGQTGVRRGSDTVSVAPQGGAARRSAPDATQIAPPTSNSRSIGAGRGPDSSLSRSSASRSGSASSDATPPSRTVVPRTSRDSTDPSRVAPPSRSRTVAPPRADDDDDLRRAPSRQVAPPSTSRPSLSRRPNSSDDGNRSSGTVRSRTPDQTVVAPPSRSRSIDRGSSSSSAPPAGVNAPPPSRWSSPSRTPPSRSAPPSRSVAPPPSRSAPSRSAPPSAEPSRSSPSRVGPRSSGSSSPPPAASPSRSTAPPPSASPSRSRGGDDGGRQSSTSSGSSSSSSSSSSGGGRVVRRGGGQ